MRRTILALATSAVVGIGAVSIASAADLPVYKAAPQVIAYNWTGPYIGVNLGYHWGRDRATTAADTFGWSVAGAAAIDGVTRGTVQPSGIMGGVQAGYNWQVNNMVWGLEADVAFLSGTDSRRVTNFTSINPADVFSTKAKATYLATLRPRVGLVWDRTLLYVTGGLALTEVKFTDSFGSFGNISVATVSSSSTRAGWTIGGGFEHAFGNKWTAKVEYLYADFGTISTSIPSCAICGAGSDITVNHKYTDNIVRFGLNYRLN
jgi:outer membrane immunogenic protein